MFTSSENQASKKALCQIYIKNVQEENMRPWKYTLRHEEKCVELESLDIQGTKRSDTCFEL